MSHSIITKALLERDPKIQIIYIKQNGNILSTGYKIFGSVDPELVHESHEFVRPEMEVI